MSKTDAVSAVTGDLFEKDWSKVRGSMQGLTGERRRAQMSRASRGHRAAVFKAIRSGGCHTRAELVRQLEYLTTKSSHIVDSRSVLDGKQTLTSKEVKKVADRYANRWSDGFHPKLGQTTHMLMSFPVGTKGEDVRDIASEVCERFFSDEENGRHFDYLIAVHEDRDHPHAHVVLNRKSQEGEFFYLGRDHHFNYDDFRIAMVEEAEKVGVKLEATRRVHRGVIDYPPRTREVYAAKEDGRVPVSRARFGGDLAATQAAIKAVAKEYARLGAKEPEEALKEPLVRAGEVLECGGRLEPTGAVYEPTAEEKLTADVQRVRDVIGTAAEAERPALQKELYGLYLAQAEYAQDNVPAVRPEQPVSEVTDEASQKTPASTLGQRMKSLVGRVMGTERTAEKVEAPAPAMSEAERLQLLKQEPSESGAYSAMNIISERTDRLHDLVMRAQIETALRGTGVSPDAIIARIETGANNMALERYWFGEDRASIAAYNGFDAEQPSHRAHIEASLERMHVALGEALTDAGILRTDGVTLRDYEMHFDAGSLEERCAGIREELRQQGLDDSRIAERAGEIEDEAYAQIEAEQKAWFADRSAIGLPMSSNEIYRENAAGELVIEDSEGADTLVQTTERMMNLNGAPKDDIAGAVGSALQSMYQGRRGEADMPEHLVRGLANTLETVFVLNLQEKAREAEVQSQKEAERHTAELAEIAVSAKRDGYPEIFRRVAYEKLETIDRMQVEEPEAGPFRREVEAILGEDGVAAVRQGDASAFNEVLDDRQDQLYATKAFMQSDPEHTVADSEAMDSVISEIVDIEFEARKLATGEVERRGLTH